MDEKLDKIKSLLLKASLIYDYEMSDLKLETYANILAEYDLYRIETAIKQLLKESRTMFVPVDVIKKIEPKPETSRDKAVDVVGLITASVKRRGWNWVDGVMENGEKVFHGVRDGVKKTFSSWREAALYEMGELALETISRRYGNWASVCETLSDSDGVILAQLRESAEVYNNKSERGNLNELPALPENSVMRDSRLSGVLKQI